MDEAVVREHAEAHGKAMVEGDTDRAGSDLMPEAMAGVGAVMKAIPRSLVGADVQSVEAHADAFVVTIRYRGQDEETVVRSRWVDQGGRPKISELTLA